MESVKISTDYIKLDQFIKWVGIASSGTESKEIINAGYVKVNGAVERQRGKKLRQGDIIEINEKAFRIE